MNLSPQQRAVMRELLAGCCLTAVAVRLGISERTANYHRNELYKRLGVHSQAQLMARYMRPTFEARMLTRP